MSYHVTCPACGKPVGAQGVPVTDSAGVTRTVIVCAHCGRPCDVSGWAESARQGLREERR